MVVKFSCFQEGCHLDLRTENKIFVLVAAGNKTALCCENHATQYIHQPNHQVHLLRYRPGECVAIAPNAKEPCSKSTLTLTCSRCHTHIDLRHTAIRVRRVMSTETEDLQTVIDGEFHDARDQPWGVGDDGGSGDLGTPFLPLPPAGGVTAEAVWRQNPQFPPDTILLQPHDIREFIDHMTRINMITRADVQQMLYYMHVCRETVTLHDLIRFREQIDRISIFHSIMDVVREARQLEERCRSNT